MSSIEDQHDDLIEELERRDDVEMIEQDVGTLRKQWDDDELKEIPEDEILETSGLKSQVLDSDDDVIGHCLMIEWDEVDDVMIPIRTAHRCPGISILLRSSPGNYHLYNLSVRPLETQLVDALRKNGDVYQSRWAARRGNFVLRILPKIRMESRDCYKPAPEPVRVFSSESDHPQSEPHAKMLLDICGEQQLPEIGQQLIDAMEEHDLVGSGLQADHYRTVTDDIKSKGGQ